MEVYSNKKFKYFLKAWRKKNADSSYQYARLKRPYEVDERVFLKSVFFVLMITICSPAMAKDRNRVESILFDIPQQRADISLVQFAQQANVTLIVPFDEVEKIITKQLVGTYRLEEAINILLTGTGLQAKIGDNNQLSIFTENTTGEEDMYKKTKLSTAILVALGSFFGSNQNVLAQGADEEKLLEEVIVTGTRGALRQALGLKRDAASAIEVVSAEDIGKFPDKNLAESLQRIPGVTINRGFVGEGNEVSIRGVNPELTHTLLNGQFMASTEWFSLGSNNRSFNMDLLPSELVSSIEVHKSPTASQDEGGVGGTVVVNTRKPLDAKDPLTVFSSIETNTNSLADTDANGTGATAYVSWKNDTDSFGVSGLYHTNEIVGRSDKAENYWEESWFAIGAAEFRQNRERETIDLTLQFAPHDNQSYSLQYLTTELEAENINQNYLLINATDVTAAAGARVSPSNPTCCGGMANVPLAGTANAAPNLAIDNFARMPSLESEVLHFTGEYIADNWILGYQLGRTEAEGGNGGNANVLAGLGAFTAGSGTSVDFNADLPGNLVFDVNSSSYNPTDPAQQTIVGSSFAETLLEDEESYAQVDLSLEVDWGVFNSIETGIKVRDHEQQQAIVDYSVSLPADETLASAGIASGAADVSGEVCTGSGCSYTRVDPSALWNYIRSNSSNPVSRATAFGRVEEDIRAIYVQGNFEGDRYRGNIGVRYVDTEVTGISSFNVVESDYTEVLPSFNLAYDLADNLILRASLSRVLSRGGYNSLNPAFANVSPERLVAAQGNSTIEPFMADQGDIGLEWYFEEGSILSAALFHKDINSFITSRSELRFLTDIPSATSPTGSISGDFDTQLPTQGKGGDITGFESQLQKQFDNGFGVLANYTYADGEGELEDGTTVDLPGTSQNSYNLTGYYENNLFSVRLAYTYRDKFLAEGTALGSSLDSFGEREYIDLSASWHITDNLDVSLEGINLTEEVTIQNFGSGLNSLRIASDNGARYFLKLAYRL